MLPFYLIMKFSTQYKRFNLAIKDIITFINNNGYDPAELALYSATSGVPIYVIHYVAYKEFDLNEALEYTKYVCDFYRLEFDL